MSRFSMFLGFVTSGIIVFIVSLLFKKRAERGTLKINLMENDKRTENEGNGGESDKSGTEDEGIHSGSEGERILPNEFTKLSGNDERESSESDGKSNRKSDEFEQFTPIN